MKFAIPLPALAAAAAALLSHAEFVHAAPDPTDAQAIVPNTPYRSPFQDYRPLGDDKLLPWKASNDEVAKIGGWRVYAKEAREPEASSSMKEPTKPAAESSKPSAPAPAPVAPAHAGHGKPN